MEQTRGAVFVVALRQWTQNRICNLWSKDLADVAVTKYCLEGDVLMPTAVYGLCMIKDLENVVFIDNFAV